MTEHRHAVHAAAVSTVAMKSWRQSGELAPAHRARGGAVRRASANVNASCACCPPDSLPALRFCGMPSSANRASALGLVELPIEIAARCSMSAADRFLYIGVSWQQRRSVKCRQ